MNHQAPLPRRVPAEEGSPVAEEDTPALRRFLPLEDPCVGKRQGQSSKPLSTDVIQDAESFTFC